ncbi:MAG TPA: PAS domain S-box protein [Tepidisphaeraceae bacterium]|nr:PAS domain S-box protein [Tepidisphaeraceae bacterium]
MKPGSALYWERLNGHGAIRIAFWYVIFGGLWILFSDRLLALLLQSLGSERWVQWQTYKGWVFILVTAALLYVLIRRVIAAIRASEQSWRKIDQRYRRLMESSMMGIATWKISGEVTDANDEFLRLFGYTRENLAAGRVRWTDMTPPEYRVRDEQALRELKQAGLFTPFEKEFIAKDGTRVPVLVGGVCTDRECDEGASFVLDLRERRATEAALRESESRFRTIFDHAGIGIAVVDPNGFFLDANRAMRDMLGYSVEELRRLRVLDVTYPEDRAQTQQDFHGLTDGRLTQARMEKRYIRKEGSIVWVRRTASVVHDYLGKVRYHITMLEDITDRKLAEEASIRRGKQLEVLSRTSQQVNLVLEKEPILRALVASARELVEAQGGAAGLMVEGKMVFREYNDQGRLVPIHYEFEKGYGVPGWVMQTGKPYMAYDAENDVHMVPEIRQAMGVRNLIDVPIHNWRGELLGCFEMHNKKGDQPFDEADQQMLQGLAAGAAIALENAQLLKERAESEAALKLAKEMAEAANSAKDRFLAALSHELRTPLTPVLAEIAALEKELRLPTDLRSDLRMVHRNVELEARLIDDLLDLTRITSGKLEMKHELVDVHGLLRHALEICQGDIDAKGLQMSLSLTAGHHYVDGDLGRLLQVFWNLIKNAVKFTPPSGHVEIHTYNQAANAGRDGQPPWLVVEVKDSGIGIDEKVMPRLFQAFQQGDGVMRQYGGLGLGLSISKAIVDLHHGKLTARSGGTGRGATFAVDLATSPVTEPQTPVVPASDTGKLHPMRILLVEDNADTARVLGRLLRSMEHRVGVADRVETALRMMREDEYDLLISDIGLPDGTGLELMREVQRIRPTKGIAISGYGMEEDVRRSLVVGFAEHLIKPITFEGLEAAIARTANA